MIGDIKRNMLASDQTIEGFNTRQAALYLGLQCEELAEKLVAVFGADTQIADTLDSLSTVLKHGYYDNQVQKADRKETLDAALSQGADVERAWKKVYDANSLKIDPATGKMTKDAKGKWIKPVGWTAPDLSDCVHQG